MSPDPVSFRELHRSLERLHEKIDVRLGAIEGDFGDHRVDDEKRFGRLEKLLIGGGVLQTIVWGLVAIFQPDASTALKAAAAVLRAAGA